MNPYLDGNTQNHKIFMIISDMTGIGHAIDDLGRENACQDHSDHS